MPKKKTTNKALSAAQKKKINDFYIENGWKDTLSKFKLSPPQGSKIITKKSKKAWQKGQDEIKEAAKQKRKAEREAAKAKKAAAKKSKKAKAPKKKAPKKKAAAPKKEKSPKKKPGRPKGSKNKPKAAKKKAAKKTARAKGPTMRKAPKVDVGDILDFLLVWRQEHGDQIGSNRVEDVIIDLTSRIRKVA